MIKVDEYKKIIALERNNFFKNSFDRAYQAFVELGLDKRGSDYFENNASTSIENMRAQCWSDFLKEESEFTSYMLKKLIPTLSYEGLSVNKALEFYIDTYPEHIYQLCLSNTQSRRSRAGKEFEHILELILIGAGISIDSQGNIGKEKFVEKGLGKLVDTVSPGVTEFEINKRNCVLISAKTTLRERWQEVPEEMGRTGAREMFLATLDEHITKPVLDTLYEANIQLTTTASNKKVHYGENSRILTFEDLIKICKSKNQIWDEYSYTLSQGEQAKDYLSLQISKHQEHSFVYQALERRLSKYQKLLKGEKRV